MRFLRIAATGCVLAAAGAAVACGESLGGARTTVEGGKYTVAYTTSPAPIVVGQHFSLDLAVCAKGGVPAPQSVRIDASMPEHRHGMNYRPSLQPLGSGVWRVEGLLWHMAGRWELRLEVEAAGTTQILRQSVTLP